MFSNSTCIIIQWTPHKGGNINYAVDCFQCQKTEDEKCKSPCEGAKYSPSKDNIKGVNVTVSGLESSTKYKFRVYTVNELNELVANRAEWKYAIVTAQTSGNSFIAVFEALVLM